MRMNANTVSTCRSASRVGAMPGRCRAVTVRASNVPSKNLKTAGVTAQEDAPNAFAAVSAFCLGVSLLISPIQPALAVLPPDNGAGLIKSFENAIPQPLNAKKESAAAYKETTPTSTTFSGTDNSKKAASDALTEIVQDMKDAAESATETATDAASGIKGSADKLANKVAYLGADENSLSLENKYTIYGTLASDEARQAGQMLVASNPSVIPEMPVTGNYPPAEDLEKYIPNATMPRANKAVSKEKPDGTPGGPTDATTLQQHVQFWDFDGDGVIYPIDTYRGFRKLGFNPLLSAVAPAVIHGTFSYPTGKSWVPDLALPIYIDNMNRTKHGSDSDTYDTEGRFVPQKFEEIFSKYDRDNKGGLIWDDIQEMVEHNMNVHDPIGWTAERLEWWATYLLLKNEDGMIPKEKIRAMYDGSIWNMVVAEVEAKKAAKDAGQRITSDPGMEANTPTRNENGNPLIQKLTA